MARECPIFTDKVGVAEECGGTWLDFTAPANWTTDFNYLTGEDIGGGSNDVSVYNGCPSHAAYGHFGWDGATAWIGITHDFTGNDQDFESYGPPWRNIIFDRFRPVGGWEAGFRPTKMRITYQFVAESGSPGSLPNENLRVSPCHVYATQPHTYGNTPLFAKALINVAVFDDGASSSLGDNTGRRTGDIEVGPEEDHQMCHGILWDQGLIGGRDRGGDFGNLPIRGSIDGYPQYPYPAAPTNFWNGCDGEGFDEEDGHYWADYRNIIWDQLQTIEVPLDWSHGQTDIGYITVEASLEDKFWDGLLRMDIVKIEFFTGAVPEDGPDPGTPWVKGSPYKVGGALYQGSNEYDFVSGLADNWTRSPVRESTPRFWGAVRLGDGSHQEGGTEAVRGGEDKTQVTVTFGSLNITKTGTSCVLAIEAVHQEQYNDYDMQWSWSGSQITGRYGFIVWESGALPVGNHDGLKVTLDLRRPYDGAYDLEQYTADNGKPREINIAGDCLLEIRNDTASYPGGASANNVTIEFGVGGGVPPILVP